MPSVPECCAWVTLTRAPALDIASLRRALGIFGSARALIEASDAAREHAALAAAARRFLSCAPAVSAAERNWLDRPHHHLVPFDDPRYPALLRTVPRCPLALYVDGDTAVLNHPQLAVVGSRNPTPQGQATAHELSEQLADHGLAITSGLAAGIDSAAHRGALAAHGVTIAVLGCGADIVYPRGSRSLREQIRQQGALISSFPLGTVPRRGNFPQRNGIVAAASLGTLVVEAARSSGSLTTARFARAFGRRLFAVPGSIHNPLSGGCHELIREGAGLTETAHDILRALEFSASTPCGSPRGSPRRSAHGSKRTSGPTASADPSTGMDKGHKILLDALGFDPADLDRLVERTGFEADAVSSMMLILELEGHVQAAPGGRYSRVFRSRR